MLEGVSERQGWNSNELSQSSNDKVQKVKDSNGNLSFSNYSVKSGTFPITAFASVGVCLRKKSSPTHFSFLGCF